MLDIELPHVMAVAKLPLHHRDPFDRLIIAQALTEGLPVISADGAFDAYGCGGCGEVYVSPSPPTSA